MLRGDLAADVRRLKGQIEGDVLVNGSGQLVGALMVHDLVDEYRLLVYPTLLGAGKRLFADAAQATALRLVEARPAGECLILIYRPATSETQRTRA